MNRFDVACVPLLLIIKGHSAMKQFIVGCWEAVMDNQHNPLRHLNLASQHYFMQVLGWMWSMVFSLTFLSIFHFCLTWMAHLLLFAGVAMTVAIFRERFIVKTLLKIIAFKNDLLRNPIKVYKE